jgi:phosphatidylserine/phosphatidylglycerophosphate/cardiolipin synthase-like enzyme
MILLPDLPDNKVKKKLRPNILKILKKPYIHAKILLIDDKFLILSSINLSSNSIDANREIWIILTDKTMIKQLNNIFIQDRNTAK